MRSFPAGALRIYKPQRPRKHLGRKSDGGYVVVDGLSYDVLLSAGVGDDSSFEIDFLKQHPNLMCHAFDGTVDQWPIAHERIHYYKKNVGFSSGEEKLVRPY